MSVVVVGLEQKQKRNTTEDTPTSTDTLHRSVDTSPHIIVYTVLVHIRSRLIPFCMLFSWQRRRRTSPPHLSRKTVHHRISASNKKLTFQYNSPFNSVPWYDLDPLTMQSYLYFDKGTAAKKVKLVMQAPPTDTQLHENTSTLRPTTGDVKGNLSRPTHTVRKYG